MTAGNAHIVFVSGLSGSGKTTAMAAIEDMSFYCVGNFSIYAPSPRLP
jgi:RNase adaptor protein for sRNA GlmZ degradation